jgi:transposase
VRQTFEVNIVSVKQLDGHVYTVEEIIEVRSVRCRRYSVAFQAQTVKVCTHLGVSIAAVALHYRLNANLLPHWVAQQKAPRGS